MRGLSSWHSMSESGPLRALRNGIFGFLTGGKGRNSARANASKLSKEGSLPVGVPPGFQPELRGLGSGKPAAVNAAELNALEQKLNVTKKEKELYEKAVAHSSNLLEGMLFPSVGKDENQKNRYFSYAKV